MKRISFSFAMALAAVGLTVCAASAQLTDHLKCYKVKDVKNFKAASADLTPMQVQFPAENCQIKPKATQLCVPVEKRVIELEGDGLLEVSGDALAFSQLCYKIKCQKRDLPALLVSDQFGSRTIEKFKPSRLCTPAVSQ